MRLDDAGRGRRDVGAAEPDLVDLGLLVPGDEVVLELEPAVVGADVRADRIVAHRQDRGRDAERSLEPERRPRSGRRRPVVGPSG